MPVKGPRLHHMVVVPVRPGQRWALILFVVILCAGIAAVAFVAGRVMTLRALTGDGEDSGTMANLERLVEQNSLLRDELSVYRGSGDVSREVEERVRTDNRELQDRVAELEQALADYRRVLLPDQAGKGLRVERLEVVSSSASNVWLLRTVLVRVGDTDGAVEGELDGFLSMDTPAGRVQMPLSQLASVEKRKFHVRYVSEIMIELNLFPGQVPVRLDLAANLSVPRAARVERSWQRPPAKPVTPNAVKPQEVPINAGQG